jgi:hypothetical protein
MFFYLISSDCSVAAFLGTINLIKIWAPICVGLDVDPHAMTPNCLQHPQTYSQSHLNLLTSTFSISSFTVFPCDFSLPCYESTKHLEPKERFCRVNVFCGEDLENNGGWGGIQKRSYVLDLVTQVRDVVFLKCIFSSGKPQGVGISEWGVYGWSGEMGRSVYEQPGTEVDRILSQQGGFQLSKREWRGAKGRKKGETES